MGDRAKGRRRKKTITKTIDLQCYDVFNKRTPNERKIRLDVRCEILMPNRDSSEEGDRREIKARRHLLLLGKMRECRLNRIVRVRVHFVGVHALRCLAPVGQGGAGQAESHHC